jgi:hypothetical protein
MSGEARRFWPRPRKIDFRVDLVDGTHLDVPAVGVAVDGEHLLFFSRWSEGGGVPLGSRIPRERIVTVTTAATLSGPPNEGPVLPT